MIHFHFGPRLSGVGLYIENFRTLDSRLDGRHVCGADLTDKRRSGRYRLWFGGVRFLRGLRREETVWAHALKAGFAAAVARLAGGPRYVYVGHGVRFAQRHSVGRLKRTALRCAELFVYWKAGAIVHLRAHDMAQARRVAGGRIDRKCVLVPTKVPRPAILPSRPAFGRCTILNVGAVYYEKAPEWWLEIASEALTRWPLRFDRALWIGAIEPRYAHLSVHNGVTFLGAIAHDRVIDLLATTRCILLNSSLYEVLPMAFIEAAALGVPVVARRFPGWEDAIGPGATFADRKEAVELLGRVAEDFNTISKSTFERWEEYYSVDQSWREALDRVFAVLGHE